MDLGKSVGVVAAHAFKPTTFAESCNGGTNSLHDVRLTVTAVVNGSRTTGSASLAVCVENPKTTWPTPLAFCDDSNCADDPGLPAGTAHGGTNTDLATILRSCGQNGGHVFLEGGVTFSTSATSIPVGSQSCLVESYGSGRAKLKFASTSSSSSAIVASAAACAGFRLNNVTLAGSGVGPRIISGAAGTGCYALIDSNTSNAAGDEFSALSIVDPTGNAVQSEGYYIKFNYTKQSDSGLPATFIYGNYTVFLGGEISGIDTSPNNNEHNIRLPQWKYVVIDAMLLKDQESGRHLIALRQDCGATTSCPNSPSASMFAITRNELRADDLGTTPVQICSAGSGSEEQTKCYDGDMLRNLGSWDVTNSKRELFFVNMGTAGAETKRFRFFQNAADFSTQDSSTYERMITFENAADIAIVGNVLSIVGGTQTYAISNAAAPGIVVKNNVCYQNGPGTCDPFPAVTENASNLVATTDPFDGAAGEPAIGPGFRFPVLRITSASPLAAGGVVDPIPSDVSGTTRPTTPDIGVFEASAGGGGGGGGGTATPPVAPVLL